MSQSISRIALRWRTCSPEQAAARIHAPLEFTSLVPQRGTSAPSSTLPGTNAKQSYDQRFRVLKPNAKAIRKNAEVLVCPNCPGASSASYFSHSRRGDRGLMVVWEDGKMKKSTIANSSSAPSWASTILLPCARWSRRRYKRLQQEEKNHAQLVLIDGGLGQLHARREALEALEIINQPLASIAKREGNLYVYGPGKRSARARSPSPLLHLIQLIRDEAHRFAVTFHRKRRQMRDRSTELMEIPASAKAPLAAFSSTSAACKLSASGCAALSAVVTRVQAEAISIISEVECFQESFTTEAQSGDSWNPPLPQKTRQNEALALAENLVEPFPSERE